MERSEMSGSKGHWGPQLMQDLGTLFLDLFSEEDCIFSLLLSAASDGFRGRFLVKMYFSYVTFLGLYFLVCRCG